MPAALDTPASVWLEIAKLLATALLAGVGAWIGGKWSVSREIERVRNERAFDQRLDWYCRAARGIVKLQWFLNNFRRAIAAGDLKKADELRAERDAQKVQIESDQREMMLFGSRATISALNLAYIRAKDAMQNASDGSGAVLAVQELNSAYFALANDVREHLGLERLTVAEANATSEPIRIS